MTVVVTRAAPPAAPVPGLSESEKPQVFASAFGFANQNPGTTAPLNSPWMNFRTSSQ